MRINHNVAAISASRLLSVTNLRIEKNIEKLSSGLRINRASDDAAGLGISERMRTQISALNQSSKNAQDAISLVQVAEGGLQEMQAMLRRMRDLAIQAANETLTTADRRQIQIEVSQLVGEVNRIAGTTQFNTKNILTGAFNRFAIVNAGSDLVNPTRQQKYGLTRFEGGTSVRGGSMLIHIGPNSNQVMTISIGNMLASALGVQISPALQVGQGGKTASLQGVTNVGGFNAINLTQSFQAEASLGRINSAIDMVSSQRAQLGAFQNRLEHAMQNLEIQAENTQAAESRIRDVDIAAEVTNFSRNQILAQSGTAMLAQANVMPQTVLSLLR
jgi:flagellin